VIEHAAQVCDTCVTTKMRRQSFPQKGSYRAVQPLELVHGDLCGPITPVTPGGRRYFLLMVDDATRFMFVALLATKDEAAQAVKKIMAWAEETDRELKVLRTDNGGEFTCSELTEYFAMEGVKRHFSAPHSPQQNGIVEWRNQTVVATARALLKQRGMPARFLGEAVVTAVHLLNRSPTKSLQGMTPYEAWHGRAPSVAHLRVFGCVASTHDLVQLHKVTNSTTVASLASSSATLRAPRPIGCMIRSLGASRLPAMSSSTKGAGGTGRRRRPVLLQRHQSTSTSSGPPKHRRHLRQCQPHRAHLGRCLLLRGITTETAQIDRRLLLLALLHQLRQLRSVTRWSLPRR